MSDPVFFDSLGLPKDARIGIDGLERVIPRAKNSHNLGWVSLYRNQLIQAGWSNVRILTNVENDDPELDEDEDKGPKVPESYKDLDAIIFSLGVAYSGAINYFFGVDDNVVRRFRRIQDFEGRLFVMNFDMPMIGESVASRFHNKSTSKNVQELDIAKLDAACLRTQRFDHVARTNNLCFGDSHITSVYRPGNMVSRNDGLTLYSILRDGLANKIQERTGLIPSALDEVTVYAGNIDVRHHLCRQEDPEGAVKQLAQDLCSQAAALGTRVRLVHLLPVENESRRLPKTGYYKGTPFYGSWKERSNLVDTFNAELDRMSLSTGFEVFRWPKSFLNNNQELDFEFMERPKSVHLSPQSYYWNLTNNVKNDIHQGEQK